MNSYVVKCYRNYSENRVGKQVKQVIHPAVRHYANVNAEYPLSACSLAIERYPFSPGKYQFGDA